MAKKNLNDLLNSIAKDSEREAKFGSIRREVNKFKHIYYLDLNTLISEVSVQLEGLQAKKSEARLKLTQEQRDKIKLLCSKYFSRVKKAFIANSNTGNFKVYNIKDSGSYFEVTIESKNGRGDVFYSFISKNRGPALEKLRVDLFTELKLDSPEAIRRIFGTESQEGGGLLQIGHREGASVAEYRATKYLRSLEIKTNNILKKYGPLESVLKLRADVETSDRLSHLKTASFSIIYVSEQGQDSNREQGGAEKAIISSIKKKLKEALSADEWANFKSSPSAYNVIAQNLLRAAKSKGAKVGKLSTTSRSKTSSNKVEKVIGKTIRSGSTDSINLQGERAERTMDMPQRNWSQLLPLINSRLTAQVTRNMGSPRLNNRTGRLAQSAQVVGVDQTREGFPSFVFDYERDPYDVFDRTLGRSPWNTPQRDPRALVDQSVREIVREMAIGRFFTRRA